MPRKTKRDLEIEIEQLKLELIQVKTELIRVKNLLETSEIKQGHLETDVIATQNSQDEIGEIEEMTGAHVTRNEITKLRTENLKLKRQLEESEDPCNLTLAEADLNRVAKRRDLIIPSPKYRIDVRGFWQYHEVRERWGHQDPKDYNEIIRWFRGKNDRKNAPPGAKFWLDMLVMFGHDPAPYDDIPNQHPLKMHVEHMFCQNMMGENSSLRNGMMNLYALESGFNTTVEFKESNTRVKLAFFGSRTERNHRAYLRWRDTGDNRNLPSMFFLRSVHCTDTDLTTPRYMASGLRSTGMTRQPRQLRITDFQHKRPQIAQIEEDDDV